MLIQFSDPNGNRYVLDVSHSELFFGSNLVGSAALPQTLTLKNVGWADISLPGISVSGSAFSIEGVNPGVLRPSEKVEFEVRFSPMTGGPSTGSIYIDAGVAGTAYVRLYGAGFSTAESNVDITGMRIIELASDLETEALLNFENGTKVWVYNDPDLELNGFYIKNGASGVGSFDGPFDAYSERMSNARIDIDMIEDVATGAANLNGTGLVPDRLGGNHKTISKLESEYQAIINAQTVQNETATASATLAGTRATAAASSANDAAAAVVQLSPFITPPAASHVLAKLLPPVIFPTVKLANGMIVDVVLPAEFGVREFARDGTNRTRLRWAKHVSGVYTPLLRDSAVYQTITATGFWRFNLYADGASAFEGIPDGTLIGYQDAILPAGAFGTYFTLNYDYATGGLVAIKAQQSKNDQSAILNLVDQAVGLKPVSPAIEAYSAWGPKATSRPAELDAIKSIKLWGSNGIARDVIVSLYKATTTQLSVNVFDPVLNDEIGFFTLSTPNYSGGGANLPDKIMLTGSDPLGSLPTGDPSGANYTGLQGELVLNKAKVVESNIVYQYTTTTQSQINPLNINTHYTVPASPRDSRLWAYRDVIECGAGRTFTTPRAAVESLYDAQSLAAMAAAPLGVSVQPTSLRASPLNPVLIVCDLANAGSPAQPWQEQNLHLPDCVSMMSRYPGAVSFEHSVGATRPIVQAHLNHQLVDIVWRNTAAEGSDYGTDPTHSSARYAVHRDYFHLFQTPDAEGDYARAAKLQIIGGSLIVGSAAGIQALGMAITVQDTVEVLDVILDTDGAYAGPLLSANNSSSPVGGGKFRIRDCWDKSGRATNVSTVAVQTKTNATYANILDVSNCKNFYQVSLSPGSGGSFVGKWLLRGNNNMAVSSSIAGDTMGL